MEKNKLNYRTKLIRFLNADRKTTRVIFTPQVKFNEGWCSFPSEDTDSGVIEYKEKPLALENAKILYEHYHNKGQC